MKKLSLVLLVIFMMLPRAISALELIEGDLMIFKGYTIKETTTISEVNKNFGAPKVTTSSAFGGQAYSYYDDNYDYYLFLETDENGIIRSYGAIGGNFKTSRYEEGETRNKLYGFMTGYIIDSYSPSYTYGGIQYNVDYDIVDKYWENYTSDSRYLYDLQPHALAATKVIAVKDGYPNRVTQDIVPEEIFYINEQLKYNNSDLYDYSTNAGLQKDLDLVGASYFNDFRSYLPNPLYMTEKSRKHFASEDYKYLFFDIKITSGDTIKIFDQFTMYINPTFLTKRERVSLTDDELKKLENVRYEYQKYLEYGERIGNSLADDNVYEEKPNYEEMPLVAGKYKEDALQLVTHFINMARVGIGIRPFTLNLDIANSAQHKAVLSYYNSQHGYDGGHEADMPPGLSSEFYDTAMKYPNENLYSGSIQSSIPNALNDGYGDSIWCGHRYNLLDPYYTDWGVGSVGEGLSISKQGAHKFSGYQDDGTELVAWPSNGIFTMDLAYEGNGGIGTWTAVFYKNYEITDDTTVTVENLATNKTYQITKENSNGSDRYLYTTTHQISFRDSGISYAQGDVFKITLHNVKNTKTNKTEDYTYRSVFYSIVDISSNPVSDIEISQEEVIVGIGESIKLSALASPSDSLIKIMDFKSKNENIATVRQDGLITGVNSGITTITIQCGTVVKTITVKVKNKDGSIPDYLKGDLDEDGEISVDDAVEALYYYIEKYETVSRKLAIGDMDNDGKITVDDAVDILMLYVNK